MLVKEINKNMPAKKITIMLKIHNQLTFFLSFWPASSVCTVTPQSSSLNPSSSSSGGGWNMKVTRQLQDKGIQ
jgi:hypothetical protein